jgi:hypothetical protein
MMPLPTDSLATFGNAFASPDVPAFPAHGAFENPPSASQAATAWGVFVTPPTDAYTEAQNAARRPNGGFPLFAPFTVK